MESFVRDLEAEFATPPDYLHKLVTQFQHDLELGLTQPNQTVKALPTFVDRLPRGSEKGKYLVVDLGGTNLRVGKVELLGKGKYSLEKQKCPIPDEIKTGSGYALFDFIACSVQMFVLSMKDVDPDLFVEATHRDTGRSPVLLGFTFSFPVIQTALSNGLLIQWNKALKCDDVIGLDVVELLQKSMDKLDLNIQVASLVNDTVGTLVAHCYVDPLTQMAVILGTGTNAAYLERVPRIAKLAILLQSKCLQSIKSRYSESDRMVVNIEWGAFGDHYPADAAVLQRTKYDLTVDAASPNPGMQTFEKLISGMYLGEIFRLVLLDARERGLIRAPPSSARTSPFGIDSRILSEIEADTSPNLQSVQSLFESALEVPLSVNVLRRIQRICSLISTRSARLCAAGIVAIYQRIHDQSHSRFVVAVDGSLFENYVHYPSRLKSAIAELLDASEKDTTPIELHLAADQSSVGAAAVIAAARQS